MVLLLLFLHVTQVDGCSDGPQILEDIVIPDVFEVMGEDAVGFVLAWIVGIALEAVDGPINPIDIRFFQISDQVVPRSVSFVVAEFP
jgi:hypothetical protein